MQFPIHAKEYFLVKPGEFEERERMVHAPPAGFSLLSVVRTAICGSDMHYWKGEKAPEKLRARIPLILLHEGVCLDVSSGKRVVPLAGYAINVPENFRGRENLWPSLPYMGATAHGLARTHFLYPQELLVSVPGVVSDEVATLTEPFSVALKAVDESGALSEKQVAVIGTGGLAYLLVLALRFEKNVSEKNIWVFGISDESLKIFNGLARLVNYKKSAVFARPNFGYDLVFEAVGGPNMQKILSFAFDLVAPGGKLGVLGIADGDILIPANRLVNHSISLDGLTRSTKNEYVLALELLSRQDIHNLARKLINEKSFLIDSAAAFKAAFDYAALPSSCGRVVIKWPAL